VPTRSCAPHDSTRKMQDRAGQLGAKTRKLVPATSERAELAGACPRAPPAARGSQDQRARTAVAGVIIPIG
jgi:hypothetical protein